MSLASLADETIAKREPSFLRELVRPQATRCALRLGPKYKVGDLEVFTDELLPLAASEPLEPTKPSTALDALARYIPTEVITLYVAALAAMPALRSLGVAEPVVYWSCAALTPLVFLLILAGKRRGTGLPAFPSIRKWPWWRLFACTLAFVVWAVAVPGGPYFVDDAGKVVAGFGAVAISTVLSLLEPVFEPNSDGTRALSYRTSSAH
jgi:hypothetical protein